MTHPNVDELVQMISYYWQEIIWLGVMSEGLLEERWHTGHGALLGGNFFIWCLKKIVSIRYGIAEFSMTIGYPSE